jgi:hypothetical protein
MNNNISNISTIIENTLTNNPAISSLKSFIENVDKKFELNFIDLSTLIKETFNLNRDNLKITLTNIMNELNTVKKHNENVCQQLLNLSNNFTQDTLNNLRNNLLLINQEVIKQFTNNAKDIYKNLSQSIVDIKTGNDKMCEKVDKTLNIPNDINMHRENLKSSLADKFNSLEEKSDLIIAVNEETNQKF